MADRLFVYYSGVLAGVLDYDRELHCFHYTYDDAYLRSDNAKPLSMSLPLQSEPAGVLESRYFFENLLPPEVVRRKLEKIIHVSWNNVFGMLKALGGDCAGAISLFAEGDGPHPDGECIRELSEDETDELLRLLPERPLLVDKIAGYRISGSGAQDKLIARLDGNTVSLPLYGAASTHIIKPEIQHLHDTVANECFCQRLAVKAGLVAAESGIAGIKGADYYWTRRFDRNFSDGGIIRLHQEDLCQAMGYESEKKYEFEGGPSLAKCLGFLRNSRLGAPGMLRFLDDFIFNFLVGNADAHAKNYAILYRGASAEVAPLYDVMCTAIYKGVPTALAMKIGGIEEMSEIRRENFVRLAEKASVRPKLILSRLDALAAKLPRLGKELAAEMSDEGHPSKVYDEILDVVNRHVEQTKA